VVVELPPNILDDGALCRCSITIAIFFVAYRSQELLPSFLLLLLCVADMKFLPFNVALELSQICIYVSYVMYVLCVCHVFFIFI
jgi:hypothetical protein